MLFGYSYSVQFVFMFFILKLFLRKTNYYIINKCIFLFRQVYKKIQKT